MKLTSPAFTDNQAIPAQYTCEGENKNPELKLADVPANAKSLSLIMHDPDAPVEGGFTHWVAFNIPADTTRIGENSEPVGTAGINGASKPGYMGPCPPTGEHRYFFKLYALDTELDLGRGSNKAELEKAMNGHIVDQVQLVGLYQKSV